MREYDTTFIVHPDQGDAPIKEITDRVAAVVQKHGGTVFYAKSLGKRQLAYPIQKQNRGTYMCCDYAANGAAVTEIERMLRLDERVFRFLTIAKCDDVNVEARMQEIIARGEDTSVTLSQAPLATPDGGESSSYRDRDAGEDERAPATSNT